MSTLDSQDIFGSGPHEIWIGAKERELDRRGFSGIDGESCRKAASTPLPQPTCSP